MDRQTVLTVALVAAILATGFVWFKFLRPAPPPEPTAAEAGERGLDLDPELARWRGLKNLVPDTTILESSAYKGLVRFNTATGTVRVESKRYNPFEPL